MRAREVWRSIFGRCRMEEWRGTKAPKRRSKIRGKRKGDGGVTDQTATGGLRADGKKSFEGVEGEESTPGRGLATKDSYPTVDSAFPRTEPGPSNNFGAKEE